MVKNESGKTSFFTAFKNFGNRVYEDNELRDGADLSDFDEISSMRLLVGNRVINSGILIQPNTEICVSNLVDGTHFVSVNGSDSLPGDFVNYEFLKSGLSWILDGDIFQPDERENLNSALPNSSSIDGFGDIADFYDELEAELQELTRPMSHLPPIVEALLQQSEKVDTDSIRVSKLIENSVPNIVYQGATDELSDEIPENAIGSESHRTFTNLLKAAGVSIDEFKQMDSRERVAVIDDASTTISGSLNNFWRQKRVNINIRHDRGSYYPLLRDDSIKDKNVSRNPRQPRERSRGFQWFLSFYINTRAVANEEEEKLMLLDDPAVFLHPEGKKDWISAMEDLAGDNQILYTSHSPYLIRKDRPSRIRLVEDKPDEGTIITNEFHATDDEETLEPLRKALGIGLGDTPFTTKRKILVEGPSDLYIIRGVGHLLKQNDEDILDVDSVSILPTGGADNMVEASRWVMSEGFSYALLLDRDQKGSDVIDRIHDEAQSVDQDHIYKLDKEGEDFHIEIEDMFPPEFYIDCLNTAYEETLDDFDPICVDKDSEPTMIGDVEYKGVKIVSKIETIFENRGYGDLNKILVANEVQSRLESGDVDEKIVENFKPVLGRLRNSL